MSTNKLETTESRAQDGKHSSPDHVVPVEMTRDEYTLATLGYRQVFVRSFGLFENVCETGDSMYKKDTNADAVGRDFHDYELRIRYACVVRFRHVCMLAAWTRNNH